MAATLAEPPGTANIAGSTRRETSLGKSDSHRRRPRTEVVHGDHAGSTGPLSTPIVHSTTYAFENMDAMNAQIELHADSSYYQRHGHPTVRACEALIARLCGAEDALLFASGMAAIAGAFMAHLRPGDHVVALRQSYGGTHGLLAWGAERCGWTYDLADARDPDAWEALFKPSTRILHVESPTNPTLAIVDIRRAADLAHAHDVRLIVDNTVATPIGQRPLELGADLVAFSATKATAGHSDLLAGAVAGSRSGMEEVWRTRTTLGPLPAPEVAWQIERSLKTLVLRYEAASATALELARRLKEHGSIAAVFHPGLEDHPGHEVASRQMTHGFGPLLSYDVGAGAAAESFVGALRLIKHATSFGGVESMVSLPAHTSHVQLGVEGRKAAGIPEGLVRMSTGIEDIEDLWDDIERALAVVTAGELRR